MADTTIYGRGGTASGTPIYGYEGLPTGSEVYGGDIISSRYLPTFAGSQYGTIDTPITFTGDFEVEVLTAITDTSASAKALIGQVGVPGDWFGASSVSGTLAIALGGFTSASVTPVTVDPFDGKLHIWKTSRIGATVYLHIDGILQTSGAGSSSITLDTIANTQAGSFYWVGQILSAKFTDAGTVVANFVFDSGSDLYQLPRGEGLGGELVSADQFFSPVANNSTISAISDYAFTMTGDGAAQTRAYTNINTVIGKLYSIKITRDSATGGTPTAFARNAFDGGGATIDSVTLSANGDYFLSFTATTTESSILWAQAGFSDTSSYSSIHVNQLPDLTCLLTNFATTDWARYTLQRNITHDAGTIAEAWVGDNKVVNGGFDTDTNWTKSAGVTISGGVLATDGTTTGELSRQSGIGLGALPYLLSIDVISLSAGSLGIKQGGGTVRYSSSLGTFKNFSTDGTLDNIQVLGLSAAVGSVDNVKTQHLLEVA